MSMPFLFEDPYITTGLQLAGIWHDFPTSSVFRGGQAGVLALQIRLAITDWLAFIAVKDGFTMVRPEALQSDVDPALPGIPLLADTNGWNDMTLGFKARVLDWNDLVVTPAFRYEIPLGASDVFQDNGDGVFILSGAAGWHHENWHLLGSIGGQIPVDRDANSTSLFYNLHVDHSFPVDWGFVHFIVPLIELNGMHWTDSGNGQSLIPTSVGPVTLNDAQTLLGTGPFEGYDVANLGSDGVKGLDLVTMAWGVRVPMSGGFNLGVSYELPLTTHEGIFGQRFTVLLSWQI